MDMENMENMENAAGLRLRIVNNLYTEIHDAEFWLYELTSTYDSKWVDYLKEIIEDFRLTVKHNCNTNLVSKEDLKNARINLFTIICIIDFYYHCAEPTGPNNESDLINSVNNLLSTFNTLYPSYFDDPASSKFHGDYEGGLVDHSIAVVEAMLKSHQAYLVVSDITDDEMFKNISMIACLFHDLCKVNNYVKTTKSKKVDGKWVNYEGYETNKDNVIIQHGPESLRRVEPIKLACVANDSTSGYISKWFESSLNEGWKQAIAWHMGLYNVNPTFDMSDFNRAVLAYPEILLMHHSDMIASKVYEI